MFIFSRRWMQLCIHELQGTLDEKALNNLVARLNLPGRGRLAAMWELVFLRGMAHAGSLRHEAPLPNGRRPDFEWTIAADGSEITVSGDITTVSDAGLDAMNPVEHLRSEVTRLAKKYKLNPNHFRYDVGGGRSGEYWKSSIKLALPSHVDLQAIIGSQVEPFIRSLALDLPATASFDCDRADARFVVTYDQAQRYSGGGYPSYDVAVSLTNNPIFRALKSKVRAGQLAEVPPSCLRLVILCDADCAAMSRASESWMTYSSRAIAEDFLRQNGAIDLVLLVTVRSSGPSRGLRELWMGFDLVAARRGPRPDRLTEASFAATRAALDRAVSTFHRPMREPMNASRRCQEAGYGTGMRGAYVSNKTLKISSRALLQLLAGEISAESFQAAHGWGLDEAGKWRSSQFMNALKSGQMIKSVRVEVADEQDDDWVEIEFAGPDAAISPFRAPRPVSCRAIGAKARERLASARRRKCVDRWAIAQRK